jgi:hypothetical protein
MFIPFDNLSPQAKIWIYSSPRNFSDLEYAKMIEIIHHFVENWESHQQKLQASYQILDRRFIILAVDESVTKASGCSIDKSVEIIRQLSAILEVDLFDRLSINYTKGQEWQSCKTQDLKNKVMQQEFTNETLVFNTLAQSKEELTANTTLKVAETWLKKYVA